MTVDDLFRLCPALDFTVEKEGIRCDSGIVPDAFAVIRVSKSGERRPFSGVTVGKRQELVQRLDGLRDRGYSVPGLGETIRRELKRLERISRIRRRAQAWAEHYQQQIQRIQRRIDEVQRSMDQRRERQRRARERRGK